MGLIMGTGSLTRFVVGGPIPEDYLGMLPQRIAPYAFRNLDEASDQERSVGWVNIMDMFDSGFPGMGYLKEPYIAMSWRVDVRRVPAKALKQYCREAEQKVKTLEELAYLSKSRREEIRKTVRGRLLKRAIPSSQTYDMIWNLNSGVVIFGATSTKLCDEFTEFFLNCFGLHLKSVFPHFTAARILEDQGKEQELLDELRYSLIEETK